MSLSSSVSIALFFDIKCHYAVGDHWRDITVGIKISGGISSGCMWYNREKPSNRQHQHVLRHVCRVDGFYTRGHRSLSRGNAVYGSRRDEGLRKEIIMLLPRHNLTCLGRLWDSRHVRGTDQKPSANQSFPMDLQLGSRALHLDSQQLHYYVG